VGPFHGLALAAASALIGTLWPSWRSWRARKPIYPAAFSLFICWAWVIALGCSPRCFVSGAIPPRAGFWQSHFFSGRCRLTG